MPRSLFSITQLAATRQVAWGFVFDAVAPTHSSLTTRGARRPSNRGEHQGGGCGVLGYRVQDSRSRYLPSIHVENRTARGSCCSDPAARNLAATLAFFGHLGFETEAYDVEYGFVQRDAIQLHFTAIPDHDPWRAAGAVFITVDDVDGVRDAFVAAGIWPTESDDPPCTDEELHRRWEAGDGLARVTPAEDKPWGFREFALMDPDNNVLRFGNPDRVTG